MIRDKTWRDLVLYITIPGGAGFEIKMPVSHLPDTDVRHIRAIFERFDKAAADYLKEHE